MAMTGGEPWTFPDLHRLRVFARVVELRSVSRAAEELSLSQPAVTHHLRRLERDTGVRLFERQGRAIAPTRAALVLYRYSSTLLDLADELGIRLQELQQGRRGQLTVGVSNTGLYYSVPLLRHYHQAFPKVRVVLRLEISDRIQELVATGAVDVGITSGPVRNSRLHAHVLAHDAWVFIAPADHPLAARSSLSPQTLAEEPFVLPPRGSVSWSFVRSHLQRIGLTPRAAMYLASSEAMKRAVESGLGLSLLSSKVAEKELREGAVRVLPVEGAPFRRPVVVLWPREMALSRPAAVLVRMARQAPTADVSQP